MERTPEFLNPITFTAVGDQKVTLAARSIPSVEKRMSGISEVANATSGRPTRFQPTFDYYLSFGGGRKMVARSETDAGPADGYVRI